MKKHILLIDDDQDELKIFVEALNGVPGSFKCTYASSGEQGIEMLRYLEPDYIFLDYNMPRATGLDVLERVRNANRHRHGLLFLYSTTITEELSRSAMILGATGCLKKTTSISLLTEELKMLLAPNNIHA
jgi:CheY-like chemotaxis protein